MGKLWVILQKWVSQQGPLGHKATFGIDAEPTRLSNLVHK